MPFFTSAGGGFNVSPRLSRQAPSDRYRPKQYSPASTSLAARRGNNPSTSGDIGGFYSLKQAPDGGLRWHISPDKYNSPPRRRGKKLIWEGADYLAGEVDTIVFGHDMDGSDSVLSNVRAVPAYEGAQGKTTAELHEHYSACACPPVQGISLQSPTAATRAAP